MTESEETIEARLREMREFADRRLAEGDSYHIKSECVGLIVHQLANQIEAAWKRERVGNVAAMRDALKYIVSLLRSDTFVVLNPPAVEIIAKIILASEAALAAPARNCDMYTGVDINSAVADAYVSADDAMMLDYDCEELPIRWLLSTPEQVEEYLKHQDEENHKMWRSIANRRNHKQEASV